MTQYLINRRENAAIRPGSLPLELDLSIPDEIFYHPVIVELSTCIADLTLVDNDILSYNREQATGNDGHNLLTCVMHELRCDVNSAMEWAAQYHARVESKFIEGLKNLPSWGAEVDTQVTEYLTRIANWPRANYCWSFESHRYFGDKGLEVQRTRRVALLPKIQRDLSHRREQVVVPLVE